MNTFSNGVTCYTVFCNNEVSEEMWSEVKKTCNLVLNLPDKTFIHKYFKGGLYNAEEAFYLFAATRFAYYFMQNPNEDFEDLYKNLGGNIGQQRKLVNIKMSIDREAVKIESI